MKFAIRTAKTLNNLFMAIVVVIVIATSAQYAEAQEHKAINLGTETGLPFSDGIVAGNTLYIAGQEGADSSGKLVSGGISAETTAALGAIQRVVKAAGFEMKDIVSVTVYLADIHDFPEMNKV